MEYFYSIDEHFTSLDELTRFAVMLVFAIVKK